MADQGFYFEVDGQRFDQRVEAMAHCDLYGYHYSAIQWVDPNAPWV
ncbi:hypothetical protein SEA_YOUGOGLENCOCO_5 [Mycobacterium phage YouGoGlencoco]|nr:hypothetical protein SEA_YOUGOGLENCOCO_5 [Mycobacterium phage YouGoGlencoco]